MGSQKTRLILNWRNRWRVIEIFCKGKNFEKGYKGCEEEKYGRYLRVAIWGNEGLAVSMFDTETIDGRPPADAEGVDVFKR